MGAMQELMMLGRIARQLGPGFRTLSAIAQAVLWRWEEHRVSL